MNLFTQDWGSCLQRPTNINLPADDPGIATLSCIWIVLQNIINAALVLSALVAVILIIYSGYQYVTSNGDKEKVDGARKRLTYAIIGLIFILMSFVIILFISQITGVNKDQLLNPPNNLERNQPVPTPTT